MVMLMMMTDGWDDRMMLRLIVSSLGSGHWGMAALFDVSSS